MRLFYFIRKENVITGTNLTTSPTQKKKVEEKKNPF